MNVRAGVGQKRFHCPRYSLLPYPKMKKLVQLFFILFLGCIILMFYINSSFKAKHEHSQPQRETVNSSYFVSDEEMNEEDEWAIHSTPIPLELKYRQYARKKRIHDLCDNNGTLGINEKWHSVDEVPNSELSNLLVDDRHGIIYCYVPKVACSEWKRIMIVLSESLKVDGVPYRHPSDIPEEQIHGNTTQYLNQYPREVMKHKLQHYKKFMFVRDPFVRLISAFRDKFLKENQPFYKYVAVKILKKFSKVHKPPKTAKEAFTAGIVPSFLNFIQYILSLPEENYTLLDEHWRQAVHLCHPCLIDYDFIGKMETVEQDAAQLLRMLQVDNIVQFPKSRSNITDESWIKIWFPDIPTDWRRNLYKIYETDYILFGYRHPEDLLNE
ncbi:carbohydrate sulfotransferase 12-like [Astyanax mexicanus]|uniref:Carbohydrate sulfotransferase n=1 Tax=Astyanax mexicanus TaxID=7994 RepID=A0A8T2MLX2_ASTMX|nr:carbohydrate sulfotransferase 12-like [Astyanax mexicanus]